MAMQQSPSGARPGVPPLDLPYYGAPPVEAVRRVFKKYAVFVGRASRSEYWWWFLFSGLASGVLNSIGQPVVDGQTTGSSPLGILWFLATVVPSLAVAARRLHDTNLSAWLLLLAVIPVLGWIALVIMLARQENPLGQRFDRYPAAAYGQGEAVTPYNPQQPPSAPSSGGTTST